VSEDRSQMNRDTGLVVARSSPVQPAISLDRLKRIGVPFLVGSGRLDIVVGV
jgi:hypothetical protein